MPITDIREQVRNAGLTQKKLSELSGVSLITINVAKRGEPISDDKAAAICSALKVPVNAVFNIQQDSRPLSEKTIQEHHRLISLILSYAEKEMLVPYNAAVKVINKPKSDRSHESTTSSQRSWSA